jgi:hypothetical protein
MRIPFAAVVLVLGMALMALAQGDAARGTATTTIGGKKVTVEYGRPALKGRNVGDLLKQLPGDRMWRAGSGAVTTLSTETDLLIGGKKVPAGKYSVYLHCPAAGSYSLVVNSDLGQPLGKIWAAAPASQANEPYPHFEYAKEIAAKEVARAPLTHSTAAAAEQLTYAFNGSSLTLSWGDQAWSLDLKPAK